MEKNETKEMAREFENAVERLRELQWKTTDEPWKLEEGIKVLTDAQEKLIRASLEMQL